MLGTALPLETGNHPREKLLISMEQFKLWRRHIILLGGLPNTSLVVTVWTITHNCYCGWMYTGRRNFTVLGSASASKEDLLTDSLQESSCLDSLGGHVSALVLVNWRLVTLGTKTTYGSFVHCFRYAKVQSDFGIIEWQVSTVLVLSFYKKLKNHPYLIQHFYCNSRLRYWRRHSLNNPIFVTCPSGLSYHGSYCIQEAIVANQIWYFIRYVRIYRALSKASNRVASKDVVSICSNLSRPYSYTFRILCVYVLDLGQALCPSTTRSRALVWM